MKKVLLGGLLALCSSISAAEDVYEIVSAKFKAGINFEDQQKAMAQLNSIVKEFEGFKSRDYFYSSELDRWTDLVIWTDLASAKKASEQLPSNELATEVFSLLDDTSVIFSYNSRIGGLNNQSLVQ
jgi:hypothetical protein